MTHRIVINIENNFAAHYKAHLTVCLSVCDFKLQNCLIFMCLCIYRYFKVKFYVSWENRVQMFYFAPCKLCVGRNNGRFYFYMTTRTLDCADSRVGQVTMPNRLSVVCRWWFDRRVRQVYICVIYAYLSWVWVSLCMWLDCFWNCGLSVKFLSAWVFFIVSSWWYVVSLSNLL